MGWKRTLLVLTAATFVVGLAACSPKSDTPDGGSQSQPTTTVSSSSSATTVPANDSNTPVTPSQDPPSQGIAVGEPPPGFSPITLPERKLVFSVKTPNNTPENAPVYLSIVDLTGGTDKHIRMKDMGNGFYETTSSVQARSMIRYTFDRFDGEGCCNESVTREAMGERFQMQYRLLLVEDDLKQVNDTIATWVDLREPHAEGTISGRVTDGATGEPIFDADVSVSGIHIGTRTDGSFKVEGLPPGEHTVIAHSDTGDFLPIQVIVNLTEEEPEEVRFLVTPAKLVPVSFDVLLPDSTPENAWIKLAGNINKLGARIAHPSRPLTPDNFFIPKIERSENNASAEFMLPEGAFIEYFYTIGPIGISNERAELGRWVFRSFIVGEGGDRRSDRVQFWNNDGWPLVTLRLIPPINTSDDAQIALNMGPSSWMERGEDGVYTTVLGTGPSGSTMSYRYFLGDSFDGADASPEANNGTRTFTAPDKNGLITDTVTHWVGQLDPTARRDDGSLSVKFRVSVPVETPLDAEIFITGDRPALGNGVRMNPHANNPWVYEASVIFGHDGPLNYQFELRSEGIESPSHYVDTDFDGQVVNDWLASWPGITPTYEVREDFIKGFYTPDYFSNNFIALSDSTYKRILNHEGSAVVISSVWSYGQSQPIPTLEYRAVRAGSVATPLEEAIEQSRIAHKAGLEVFFGPQFNMEQAPGGFEVYNGPKTDEWWIEWLKLADEMWTWQATVAEMVEAEYMMVPGPLFHVYDQIDKPSDDPFIINFEAEQARLMAKIRTIYSGKLIVTGGPKRYDFPALADYNGVTTYDIGVPQLPADATVADFVEYYEQRFVERVDTIYEKWANPVFFYTIHAPNLPTATDPSGELAQANAYEAIFQVISKRPFINGALTWSYDMIDAPLIPTDGVRGRLAEAILAKWYAILGG
jgi:hypothetical protein